jgi:hypothetical protein
MKRSGARSGEDSRVGVYSLPIVEEVEEQPLLDLRTRLVLWFLCLFFVGLVYLGLNGPPV